MPQTAASAAFVHGYGWVVTSAEPGTLWETSDGGRSWQIGSKHFQHITAFKLWAPERVLALIHFVITSTNTDVISSLVSEAKTVHMASARRAGIRVGRTA